MARSPSERILIRPGTSSPTHSMDSGMAMNESPPTPALNSNAQLLPHPASRSRKATTACQACQKRKSKCVGGHPCGPCQKANTECIVNADNDGRRRITLKRKIESLEHDRELLVRLMETIRNQDDPKSRDALKLIRSNAPLDEIRSYVLGNQGNDHTSALRDPENPVKIPKRSPSIYMDVKRLTDMPLFEVPAKPWTSVTEDDAFVSHLVSLYFTWQQPTFTWVDKDLFVADMKAGKLGSRFCSPLLVNIILTVACFYSDYPESLANPNDPATRGEHFFAEAVRLLGKEEGRLSLTTFQALGDMYTSACVMGKDRLGWQYLRETADCLQQIIKKQQKMIADAKEQSEQMTRSLDVSLAGFSSFIQTSTISYQKSPLTKRPTHLKRFPEDHDPNDTWTPYPQQTESTPAHSHCLMNCHSDLAPVIWDITDYIFGDSKPPIIDIKQIDAFQRRLETLMNNIPYCIRLGETPTVGVMELHMRYHNTMMVMYGFVTTCIEENDMATKERINSLRMNSAWHIGAILNQYRSKWPVERMPMALMQYSTLALFTLLDGLKDERNQVAFTENLTALCALARRWQLAKGMLRLVQLTAIKQDVKLPAESEDLLREFETQCWNTDDRERFSSHYPNFAMAIQQKSEGSVDDVDLDRLLEQWDDLTMSERSPEDDSSNNEKAATSDSHTADSSLKESSNSTDL